MMNYIIVYLIIGVVFLLITYISTCLDNSQEAKDIREIRTIIKPKSKNLKEQILNKLIVPVIAMSIALIFWPAAVTWVIKDRLERRAFKNRVKPEPEVFKMKNEHLKEQVSIEYIESQEMISDPLNAVPEVPFGHLNSAWQEFKDKLQPEDEIWAFSAQWTSEWGSIDHRTGYVIIQEDKPVDYFTVSIKYVD